MFAKTVLTDEERVVDPLLGYPRGYAKLCRHAHIHMQGLISPYTEGPPQRFQPYSPQDEEIAKLKGYDDLFPILEEEYRDTSNPKKYIESLWQQLDHLGNAGFDPAIFRVDTYGNVLYRDADRGSPLAWEVDYWYPHSRGGKTVPDNLRLVQWQASHRKGKKLEFLAPWWDLQLGVSVNQFLSAFASKNVNFRHRAFTFFFTDGENEQIKDKKVVQSHSWPRQFKESKNQVGLAAAALVRVPKNHEGGLKSLVMNKVAVSGIHEDDVRRELQKAASGQWKDMDDKKWRRGFDKENKGSLADKNSEEQSKKQSLEIDKHGKMEESMQFEEELKKMKAENVKEKAILDELEQALAKQKKQVEKQRRWSETQSQYRLCLEKMIRDTIHQCVVYKEQARLNQAACNSLLARLELQKSTCDEAEMELRRKMKHREELEVLARPKITKRVRHQGHTDVGSCLKANAMVELNPTRNPNNTVSLREVPLLEGQQHTHHSHVSFREEKLQKSCVGHNQVSEMHGDKQQSKEKPIDEDERHEAIEEGMAAPCRMQRVGPKRKALEVSGEMDVVLLGYEYQEDDNVHREESVGDNGGSHSSNHVCSDEDDEDVESNNANQGKGVLNFDMESNNNVNQGFERNPNNVNKGFESITDISEDGDREGLEGGCDLVQHKARGKDREGVEEGCDLVQRKARGEERLAILPADACPIIKNTGGKEPIDKDTNDKEQLDELLQEVLAMQDKVNEAMVGAIQDEEHDEDRVKRLGKLNLDRWLQRLLLDSGYGQDVTLEAGRQMEESMMAHNYDLEVARGGGVIRGLLKKFNFKNGGLMEEVAEDTNLPEERKPETTKRSDERRISPWRWPSPGSRRRSVSAGPESRPRCLSPWRRSSKDDKAEERKMMESFTKLRLGGGEKPGGEPTNHEPSRRHSMQWGSQGPLLQSVHHVHTPPPARKTSMRSTSTTPPLKQFIARVPPRDDASMPHLVSKGIVGGGLSRATGGGTVRNNGIGGGDKAEYGGTTGGAARKATMLKKSASTRPADKGKQLAISKSRGGNGGATVKGGGAADYGKEESVLEVEKGSLFEDLDAQDGLRASLSLAWKKAVKKFDLGRLPNNPTPAHLEL